MNKVEITEFEFGKIEMKSLNVNKKINAELGELLYKYTNQEWVITVNQASEEMAPLKELLVLNAEKTAAWNKVAQHFPEAKITDILLKK
ncbi:MAG: hypothetical protein K0Q51_658 [Rickettsiaceae bacterium]|jgi:hypothetical protein|nr:hypothetical protein [Rickettsiaceae bacterium]